MKTKLINGIRHKKVEEKSEYTLWESLADNEKFVWEWK